MNLNYNPNWKIQLWNGTRVARKLLIKTNSTCFCMKLSSKGQFGGTQMFYSGTTEFENVQSVLLRLRYSEHHQESVEFVAMLLKAWDYFCSFQRSRDQSRGICPIFLRYCCPECDFNCKETHLFFDHAIDQHENSNILLKYEEKKPF